MMAQLAEHEFDPFLNAITIITGDVEEPVLEGEDDLPPNRDTGETTKKWQQKIESFSSNLARWIVYDTRVPEIEQRIEEIKNQTLPIETKEKLLAAWKNELAYFEKNIEELSEEIILQWRETLSIVQKRILALEKKEHTINNKPTLSRADRSQLNWITEEIVSLKFINKETRTVLKELEKKNMISAQETDIDLADFDKGSPADLAATEEEIEDAFMRATN